MSSIEHRLVDVILFLTKVSTPLFVWVFGMTMAYVYYDQLEDAKRFQRLKHRVWKRALYVFLAHQFLVVVIDTYERPSFDFIISHLFYQRLGNWIEVLNFYLVILFVTPWVLQWWRKTELWARCIIIPGLYAVGFFLADIEVPQILFVLKDIVTGHRGSDTFPVLQFSPFYLVGLSFGEFLFERVRDKQMRSLFWRTGLIAVVCAAGSFIWSGLDPIEYIKAMVDDLYKFPAQPPYILLGFSGILLVTLLCLWVFEIKKMSNAFTAAIEMLGRHSLLTFVLQYIFLFTMYGLMLDMLHQQRFIGSFLNTSVAIVAVAFLIWAWERWRRTKKTMESQSLS
ncbi:MAG: hypothetical protein HW412_2047 [Bacteroidetes bacterium]|nr:hypothetical protein [Bacteroidota bacterium]